MVISFFIPKFESINLLCILCVGMFLTKAKGASIIKEMEHPKLWNWN